MALADSSGRIDDSRLSTGLMYDAGEIKEGYNYATNIPDKEEGMQRIGVPA